MKIVEICDNIFEIKVETKKDLLLAGHRIQSYFNSPINKEKIIGLEEVKKKKEEETIFSFPSHRIEPFF